MSIRTAMSTTTTRSTIMARENPHPASPFQVEEQIALGALSLENHRPATSPYQGEVGWGLPPHAPALDRSPIHAR